MHGDVERSYGRTRTFDLFEYHCYTVGKRYTPARDAKKNEVFDAMVSLGYLVSDAADGSTEIVGVDDFRHLVHPPGSWVGRQRRDMVGHLISLVSLTGLSLKVEGDSTTWPATENSAAGLDFPVREATR